jgi:hypothetical protein
MKTNSVFSYFGLVVLLVSIINVCLSAGRLIAATDDNLGSLTLALSTPKQDYILGEPVPLGFKVTNNSNSQVQLPGLIDVYGGTLQVFVAFEDGPYRQYLGLGWSMWGTRTIKPPVLDPGGSVERTATILHNRAPQRGHLNDQRWAEITERNIDTEIALPKPGRYRIKATLFGKTESRPLEIYVREPQTADDLAIWKIMSKEPKYVFFMQTGDFLSGTLTSQENKEFVDAIENLTNYHSTSTYAPYFRAAITQYRERYLNATKAK